MSITTRFLLVCASFLALPAVATAQTPPPLSPGWYSNGTSALICEDCAGSTLQITWQNSYVCKYPGTDPLYWYAQIMYLNTGSKTLNITCDKNPDPSAVRENMSGTRNSGYVTAEETFCSRNPGRIVSLEPGEALDNWAIFHNVPWKGGQVSLADDYYGSSTWVDPWASPYPAGEIPPPAECLRRNWRLDSCQVDSRHQL